MGPSQSQQAPTPEQGAQAQAMAQQAGTMFNIATAPQQAYAEALDQIQLNPTFQRVQSATQNNSALQNAKGNQAISAITNPYGSAGSNAFNRAASNRLSSVMGQASTPGLTASNTQGAFAYPTTDQLPDLKTLTAQAKQIGQALPSISFWNDTPYLMYPDQNNQQQHG